MPGSGGSRKWSVDKLEVFAHSLDEIEFSARVSEHLSAFLGSKANLRDLVIKTEIELMAIEGFGRKALNEVKEVLEQKGLQLGMDEGSVPTLTEIEAELNHTLSIVGGMDYDQLNAWVIDVMAGDIRNLPFQVAAGSLNISTLMRSNCQRLIAESVRDVKPLRLTLENMRVVLVFDPKTQKGSLKLIF